MTDKLDAAQLDEHARRLFARLPDEHAREELVRLYYPLIASLARRYQGYGEPYDDLLQVASIGLLKAIERFDPGRGVRFSSYVTPTVVGELKRHFRDRAWSVRVPRRLQEHALLLRDVVEDLSQDMQRSPTVPEIAQSSGLTDEEVIEAMDALNAYTGASLDAPAEEDEGNADYAPLLATDEPGIEFVEGWVDLEPHLARLGERDRRILYLRFFRSWTQGRIARELGISQMHVSRLLSQTLQTLRDAVHGAEG